LQVIKPASIQAVLHIGAARDWPVHQVDVKNAFLHGNLAERILCHQPAGFVDPTKPDHVCLLYKSLYGLKQVPQVWFERFSSHLGILGFTAMKSDTSLFVYQRGADLAYILLYVDDIILTASNNSLLQHVVQHLRHAFTMKDLSELQFFLGIQV
jgi:hypothetical protein